MDTIDMTWPDINDRVGADRCANTAMPANGTGMSATIEITDLVSLRASRAAVVTRAEVARVLRIDVRTVSRAIEDASLPSLRVGRPILIPRERLLAMLAASDEAA